MAHDESHQNPQLLSTVLPEIRQEGGLSRGEFAELLKVHPSTVTRYENHSRIPGPAALHGMAQALACCTRQTYDELLLRLTKSAAATQIAVA